MSYPPERAAGMYDETDFFVSSSFIFYCFSTSKQLRICLIFHRLNPRQNHQLQRRRQNTIVHSYKENMYTKDFLPERELRTLLE